MPQGFKGSRRSWYTISPHGESCGNMGHEQPERATLNNMCQGAIPLLDSCSLLTDMANLGFTKIEASRLK